MLFETSRRAVRDSVSLASGGVEARGRYFRPAAFASARAAPSSLYLASRASALAVYSALSQVLRKDVSDAVDFDGPDMAGVELVEQFEVVIKSISNLGRLARTLGPCCVDTILSGSVSAPWRADDMETKGGHCRPGSSAPLILLYSQSI